MKISPKTVSTSRKKLYFIFSTLITVLFGQVTPKPNQKHHLDPIGLLMDGSGSGFLKSRSGSAKKPGSIRIRNTTIYCTNMYNCNDFFPFMDYYYRLSLNKYDEVCHFLHQNVDEYYFILNCVLK